MVRRPPVAKAQKKYTPVLALSVSASSLSSSSASAKPCTGPPFPRRVRHSPVIARAPRRHYAASFGLKKSRAPSEPKENSREALRTTERLMNAAANADGNWPGWERRNPRDAERDLQRRAAGTRARPGRGPEPRLDERGAEPRLAELRLDEPRSKPPSRSEPAIMNPEEMAVRQEPGLSDAMEEEDLALGGEHKIVPGTFVEIRRNGKTGAGVVLHETVVDNRIRIACLTRGGNLWEIATPDIFFVIPHFTPTDVVSKCGTTSLAATPQEQAARVHILRQLVQLEREVELVRAGVARSIDALYGQLRADDPEAWAHASLPQIAALVAQPVASPTLKLMAVHRHLMARSDRFVANPLAYRHAQTFAVRPQAHVAIIDEVTQMTRTRSPVLDAFFAKAQHIIARSRAVRTAEWHAPASVNTGPAEDPEFTPAEQKIVRFLQLAFHKPQWVQSDPYQTAQVYIAQRLLARDRPVDNDSLYELMTDLSLLAPWDDLALREHEEVTRVALRATPAQRAKEEAIVQRFEAQQVSAPAPTQAAPLGPEDLYAQDPLDEIRHDFGEMPVHVIDDVGAQELDDGVSFEACSGEPGSAWVHIHIADPTALIPPTHVFAQQARQLGQTIYATTGTVPMLPHALVAGHVSLGSQAALGGAEKVMTFSVKVDAEGDIADYKIRAGIVRNVHVLRYDQDVNRVLGIAPAPVYYPFGHAAAADPAPAPPPASLAPADERNLKQLYAVSERLLQARRRLPVFMPYTSEASVSVLQPALPAPAPDLARPPAFAGFPAMSYTLRWPQDHMHGARQMVAEFMVLAGRSASRFCVERRLPMVRRCAAQALTPSDAAFAQLLALRNETGGIDNISIARLGAVFPASTFSPEPLELWNLGVPRGEGYSRVTSPLRRYEDLLGHWQLKHALLSEHRTGRAAPLLSAPQVGDACAELAYHGATHKLTNTRDRRFWLLAYIRRWIADPAPAPDRAQVDFENLEGTVAAAPTRDMLRGNFTARVFFKQLGIYGSLLDVPNNGNVPIGETMRMKLKTIEIGHQPRMIVEPA